jgi:eukaryotic-like serine/threonine-protein kinase
MLGPSDRIGPYEVVGLLGAGGMGEVYRARDSKLGREVAIKVLPAAVAGDPERLARFEREARLLASLNHSNIASIYGLEGQERHDRDGRRVDSFIVMELVEGDTLDERLRLQPGRALSVPEALAIARQLCDALDAAHERGVVHRDLKPANIKITPDGVVKVLDFGLAKADAILFGSEGGSSAENLTRSPTVMAPTVHGVLLGTAPYMSPEQARGKSVDKRTDIWAFGCVLYQMLAGQRAFPGETATDAIAAILEREPDWTLLPAAVPAAIRRLLRRCLQKDRRIRLRDIGDARLEIEEALGQTSENEVTATTARGWHPAAAGAAIVVAAALAAVAAWTIKPAPVASRPAADALSRFVVIPAEPVAPVEEAVAVSPDGRRIAYVAGTANRRRIYVREIDRYDSTPVADTDGADSVVFSADGRSLAFLADRKLKTVPLAGGSPLVVREGVLGGSFEWLADGSILFNPSPVKGILRLRPESEAAETVSKLDPHEDQHRFPRQLPGSRVVLYSAWSGGGLADDQVFAHDPATGQRKALVRGTGPQYLATGHLVYVRGGSLFAVPFDPIALALKGNPVVVLEGVRQSAAGTPQISFSHDGTMVYVSGASAARQARLVWVDRSGAEQPAAVFDRPIAQPRLSPDGRRVAVIAKGDPDVWQVDLTRDTWTRSTFDGTSAFPLWRPDGRLTFSSGKDGPYNIYTRTTDARGSDERLFAFPRSSYPLSWSPDARLLAFVSLGEDSAQDIWLFDSVARGEPRRLLASAFAEGAPVFAPDGRSFAYVSNESGRPEIYLQTVDGSGEKQIVSSGGGVEPVWPRHSRELFYRNGSALIAVEVATGGPSTVGRPRRLFEGEYEGSTAFWSDYDADAQGQRFLMIKGSAPPAAGEIRVVTHWFEELKARVPIK